MKIKAYAKAFLVLILISVAFVFQSVSCYANDCTLCNEVFGDSQPLEYRISKSALNDEYHLKGKMTYLPDAKKSTVAIRFDVIETTLTNDSHQLMVQLDVLQDDMQYILYVDEQGIVDDENSGDFASAKACYIYENGIHSFTVLVDFKDASVSRQISVSLYCNGTKYLITDSNADAQPILLDCAPTTTESAQSLADTTKAKTTTTKSAKTTQATTAKTTQATTAKTTKYSPSGEYTQPQTSENITTVNASPQETASLPSQDKVQTMSLSSKTMLVAGGVVSLVGASFVVIGAISHSKLKLNSDSK